MASTDTGREVLKSSLIELTKSFTKDGHSMNQAVKTLKKGAKVGDDEINTHFATVRKEFESSDTQKDLSDELDEMSPRQLAQVPQVLTAVAKELYKSKGALDFGKLKE